MTGIPALNAALTGRYRIERELGRGGMAVVFLAEDLKLGRKVALKVMSEELAGVVGAERFLTEVRVTASLQHPNILPLFDSGEAAGRPFYVMPYVEGESLRARLARERVLPVEEALHIASLIASALDHAHARGIVHRDLKPENILLRDAQPLVADFGIALAVQHAGGARLTQSGISLGTPQYMSPEQAAGEGAIDGRSDLYALGAVTYEMLTGEPPHSGPSSQAVIARVLSEIPRRPRAIRPTIPIHVERAIGQALAKLPADRPRNARSFAEALTRTSAEVAPAAWEGAEREASAVDGGDFRRRFLRAWLPWSIAAIAVAASLAQFGREVPAAGTVRVALAFDDSAARQVPRGVALSPDGALLAFVGGGPGPSRRIQVRPLDDTRIRTLEGTEGASQLFFSPDGEWIGYYRHPYLMKVRVAGGSPVLIGEVPDMLGAAWGRDGSIVVSTAGVLARIADAGGSPRPFTTLDSASSELSQRWPLILPDGRSIAYSSRRRIVEETRIGIARPDGGVVVTDLAGTSPLAMVDGRLFYISVRTPSADLNSILAVALDPASGATDGPALEVERGVAPRGDGAGMAAMSQNGSLFLLSDSEPESQLVRSGPGVPLTMMDSTRRHYLHPRYAPDGSRLVFAVDPPGTSPIQVHVMEVATGGLTRVNSDSLPGFFPEWSSDGGQVLFTLGGVLYARSPDARGPAVRVDSIGGGADWSVSADGRSRVVRVNTQANVRDLFVRDVTGVGGYQPLQVGPENTFGPRISPDGRWVAFWEGDAGFGDIWVTTVRPGGPRIRVSFDGGVAPVWSRDGRRLFYQYRDRVMVATVATVPTFAVLRREVFVPNGVDPAGGYHANYDVTPDGTAIVYPRRTDPPPQWILVHRWTDGLRARLSRPASD